MRGTKLEGCLTHHLVAGYTHFHFASCVEMVENWIAFCKEIKRMGKALPIMFQGTHSDAGKSVIVTAFCRIFAQDGFKTAPFKFKIWR